MKPSSLAQAGLQRILTGESLSREEMRELFGELMDGGVSDVMKAAVLAALGARGERVEEIAGAAEAMRARAVAIPHCREDVVDTCGTGGDGRGTFNISTAAAVVAAAAGAVVAKHGNRSVSSRSGSADVLAAMGLRLDVSPETSGRALDRLGLAFLFAPVLHPAMREVMPVRRELGVRTLFNLLGPLTNPAGARRQLMGVYAPGLVERIAGVLAELGAEHAWVVHGSDGLDEITVTGTTWVGEVREGSVRLFELTPEEAGLRRSPIAALAGGTPEENASAMRRLFEAEDGPLADVVVLNAAAALLVGGVVRTLRDGMERGREVLRSGAATQTFERLVAISAGGALGPSAESSGGVP